MSKVLVLYATRHGSTREVADVIASTLRELGCDVDLHPAGEMRKPLAGADLVVLGAPLYSGRWHNDAHRFLKRHRGELVSIPVAIYGMGPRDNTVETWQAARKQLNAALTKHGWLTPAAVAVFGGVDPPKRHLVLRRDLRDWNAIRDWASSLPIPAPSKLAPAYEAVS
ncbi:MAG: flavodoxin domain-containing protein [Candidatus Dormiibacterota bacterium]